MKAKVKITGEIVDVKWSESYYKNTEDPNAFELTNGECGLFFRDDLDFIQEKDWDTFKKEQFIQTAHEMLVADTNQQTSFETIIHGAETFVDVLIKRLKEMDHERV